VDRRVGSVVVTNRASVRWHEKELSDMHPFLLEMVVERRQTELREQLERSWRQIERRHELERSRLPERRLGRSRRVVDLVSGLFRTWRPGSPSTGRSASLAP